MRRSSFARGGTAVHAQLDLPDDVLACLDIAEEPLREGHELVRRPVHQAAIDPRVIVEGAAVERRIEPVLPAHVAAQAIVNVAPGGEIADFRFEVEGHRRHSPVSPWAWRYLSITIWKWRMRAS
jgi:hypothetical protein